MGPGINQALCLGRVYHINRTLLLSTRLVHSTSRHHAAAGLPAPSPTQPVSNIFSNTSQTPQQSQSQGRKESGEPPLACLPTSSVIRSYLITRMSSSPFLLGLCFKILRKMLDSKSVLLNLNRNPILAKILKSTFYAQFCVGETKGEVARNTTQAARERLGYDGIILEYSLEVLEGENSKTEISEEQTKKEVQVWMQGMMDSVEVAREGDFIGLKWSGLGHHALHLLKQNLPPTSLMEEAIHTVCRAAAAKNVSLLPGAEEEMTNPGIEAWNMALQREYNTNGCAVIYTTYQCYIKATASKVAKHLEDAKKHGYVAGVKLVRGAYLDGERERGVPVWENQAGTDACYNGVAEAVLKREWTGPLAAYAPADKSFPELNIVLATHNAVSISKAFALRQAQAASNTSLPKLAYAQLQGMADEISLDLVAKGKQQGVLDRPRVFKCMTWGTTSVCLNFLLRRAAENKDAMSRTVDMRKAMGKELMRRARVGMGLRW